MSFKSIILRNEKRILITLVALVFIETVCFSIAAIKGISPSQNGYFIYGLFYIVLLIYWCFARCDKLNASLDKGYFYWCIWPLFYFL